MGKINFLLITFLCFGFCLVGCSDEDIQSSEIDTDNNEILYADTMNCDRVISMLCTTDTLSIGTVEYKPINGEVLDEFQPTVFSICVDSEAEAQNFFYTHCVPIGEEDNVVKGSDGTLVYSLGTCGSLKYTPVNDASMMGYIDIDVYRLDCMTKIELIPSSSWPYNDSSPFYEGDVVKDRNGWYWLCVRAYAGSKAGILMTWDGGTGYVEHDDHYKKYKKVWGCASRDAWNALAQLYYDDPEEYQRMCTYLRRSEKLTNKNIVDMMECVYGSTQKTHQVGDMWDHKYYWAGRVRHVWEASTDYVKVGGSGSIILNKNYVPEFDSGKYYFKRNWNPTVPDCRNSHSITFSPYDKGGAWSTCTKIYPENHY